MSQCNVTIWWPREACLLIGNEKRPHAAVKAQQSKGGPADFVYRPSAQQSRSKPLVCARVLCFFHAPNPLIGEQLHAFSKVANVAFSSGLVLGRKCSPDFLQVLHTCTVCIFFFLSQGTFERVHRWFPSSYLGKAHFCMSRISRHTSKQKHPPNWYTGCVLEWWIAFKMSSKILSVQCAPCLAEQKAVLLSYKIGTLAITWNIISLPICHG